MRVADALIALTVGVGAISAARQLHEKRQVRTGRRAPTLATTRILPSSTGRLEAVAHWQPGAPRTRLGRVAAAAWAAPLTVLGAGLVAAGGGRAAWNRDLGAYVALGVSGLSGGALRLLGVDANAVGQVIVCRGTRPSRSLLLHEAAHVRQCERLGPAIVPLYLWFGARFGYRDNPLERAARLRARSAGEVRTIRS